MLYLLYLRLQSPSPSLRPVILILSIFKLIHCYLYPKTLYVVRLRLAYALIQYRKYIESINMKIEIYIRQN